MPEPAPAPPEVTPPASYAPPIGYQTSSTIYQAPATGYPAPSAAYQAPPTAPATTTTTTTYYYSYPSTAPYYSYRPGYYLAPPETATIYYGQ